MIQDFYKTFFFNIYCLMSFFIEIFIEMIQPLADKKTYTHEVSYTGHR